MSVIQFETTVEDNLIRIPEQYIGQIPVRVAVILVDVEKSGLFEHSKTAIHDIEAASMSSMDFWDNQDDEVWENV